MKKKKLLRSKIYPKKLTHKTLASLSVVAILLFFSLISIFFNKSEIGASVPRIIDSDPNVIEEIRSVFFFDKKRNIYTNQKDLYDPPTLFRFKCQNPEHVLTGKNMTLEYNEEQIDLFINEGYALDRCGYIINIIKGTRRGISGFKE